MVRKSEVFVEYEPGLEPGSEMPLSWARGLARDLRRGGRYRAVKVSKSRATQSPVVMGRVWVDQRSSRAVGCGAGKGESPVESVAAGSTVGKEAENGEVA